MSSESWRARLKQASRERPFADPEIKVLIDFLRQLSLDEYLGGMRDEVWHCGEVREMGGLIESRNGTVVGKTAAVQLYWDYDDAEEIMETYRDMGRAYEVYNGRFRSVPSSLFIVFGVARITVGTSGEWEPRLLPHGGYRDRFEIGDYFYHEYTFIGVPRDRDKDWKYGGVDTTGSIENIKLPQSPQRIQ